MRPRSRSLRRMRESSSILELWASDYICHRAGVRQADDGAACGELAGSRASVGHGL
ncbi:hypothetical protein CBM2625_U80003 [Cupriavidus taiwanensis]|nr:hypothetical protein CBM2625_U80003 [Cupriavidus taiwanensis]